jgi:hypothetical protein
MTARERRQFAGTTVNAAEQKVLRVAAGRKPLSVWARRVLMEAAKGARNRRRRSSLGRMTH